MMHCFGAATPSRLRVILAAALLTSPLAAQQAPPVSATGTQTQPTATAAGKALPPASNRDRIRASKLYAEGAKAMEASNPRLASQDFGQAAELDPSNPDYANAAEIARQHLLTQLVQDAAKARLLGQQDLARTRLEEALKIDPQNLVVKQHIGELAGAVATGDAATPYTSSGYASIQLAPQAAQHEFHIRANATELLRQIFGAYGITAVMDDSVRPQSLRIDIEAVGFEKAAEMAGMLTRTFYVPLDPKRVLIAMDTKENRQKFERVFEETINLSGMTAAEMSDIGNLVRNIFDAPQSVVQAQAGTLVMRAPEATLQAVNATLSGLMEGRGQVLIEMRIFSLARTRTRNIGIQLPQQATVFNIPTEVNKILTDNASLVNQIISSGLAKPGDFNAIAAILVASGAVSGSILGQPFAVFGGGISQEGVTLGTVAANFSLNTSQSREIDQVLLRAEDQEAATLRSGTRYPIVTSVYSSSGVGSGIPGLNSPGLSSTLQSLGINLAAASTSQVIPQVQYEDLGLTLKATPHIQRSREITLTLEMKVEALGGSVLNGNPILNSRQYNGTITVRDGETAVLLSDLDREESKAVSGIPGLSEIPGLRSTTDTSKQVNESNLMIMITPHLVRARSNQAADPMLMMPRH